MAEARIPKRRPRPPRRAHPIHRAEYAPVQPLLRRMREDAGLTTRALAQRLDRPHAWVTKSETGQRRIDIIEFLAWCRACKVKFADAAKLLGYE